MDLAEVDGTWPVWHKSHNALLHCSTVFSLVIFTPPWKGVYTPTPRWTSPNTGEGTRGEERKMEGGKGRRKGTPQRVGWQPPRSKSWKIPCFSLWRRNVYVHYIRFVHRTLNVLFTCWNKDAVASSQCTPRPRHLSYVGVLKHVDAIHVKFRATGTAERSLVTQ